MQVRSYKHLDSRSEEGKLLPLQTSVMLRFPLSPFSNQYMKLECQWSHVITVNLSSRAFCSPLQIWPAWRKTVEFLKGQWSVMVEYFAWFSWFARPSNFKGKLNSSFSGEICWFLTIDNYLKKSKIWCRPDKTYLWIGFGLKVPVRDTCFVY